MYENFTYEELRNLSEDKKSEAWKELHILYPENKVLAQKLNVATIAVVNAVKKYVLGEPVGRAKKKVEIVPLEPIQETQKIDKQESQQPPKRKYNRKAKSDMPEIRLVIHPFSINISNIFTTEEAQTILNGIGSTLLKNKTYKVEINISEG